MRETLTGGALTCCDQPPHIDRWDGSLHQSSDPVYVCATCEREGFREEFDPAAAALDKRLFLPMVEALERAANRQALRDHRWISAA